jgi:Ca2+-binding EF-hand superfamily protein
MKTPAKIILAAGAASIIAIAATAAGAQGRGWHDGRHHGFRDGDCYDCGYGSMHHGYGSMHHGYRQGRHHGWRGHRGWRGHGMRHRFRKMLERYDANGDRKLTQEEINSNREAWLKEFDADGNGKLSLDEFKQLWLKARAERIVRSFQRFDRDGDAGITLQEYQRPLANIVERRDRNGDGAIGRDDMRRGGKWHRGRYDRMNDDAGDQMNEEPEEMENENTEN